MPFPAVGKMFRVVQERTAVRCEVCHQADQFDPETGMCGRCHPAVGPVSGKTSETEQPAFFSHNFHPALVATRDQFQLVFSSPRRRPRLSFKDLLKVGRLALTTWFRLFPYLVLTMATTEFPLALAVFGLVGLGVPQVWPVYLFLVAWLTPVSQGIAACFVVDLANGRSLSVRETYRFVRSKRRQLYLDWLEGGIQRWAPAVTGTLVGAALGEAFLYMTGFVLPGVRVPFWMGLWIGLSWLTKKAYAQSFFITETAILEHNTAEVEPDAWTRSCWLGDLQQGKLFPLNALSWLFRVWLAAAVLRVGFQRLVSPWSAVLWYPLLPVFFFEKWPSHFIVLVCLRVLFIPGWQAFKTYLYLSLRQRALGQLPPTSA